MRLPEFLALEHLGHRRIEADGIDAHHFHAAVQHVVHRFLGHTGMIGEVTLVKPLLRGIRPEQHDVERLDAVAVERALGRLDVVRRDLVARRFVREVQHDAVAIAVLDRNALGTRRVGFDVSPRVDVRANVIAGDDHAVVGDLVDAVDVGADALGHLTIAFHLDDDRLGDVWIRHHPLEDFHAEIDEFHDESPITNHKFQSRHITRSRNR